MSYIRTSSNPEGLYVWGGPGGTHFDLPGDIDFRVMKNNDWELFLDWYINGAGVDSEDDKSHMFRIGHYCEAATVINVYEEKIDGDFKIVLEYERELKHWKLVLWEVTWRHIINGVMDTQRHNRKLKTKLLNLWWWLCGLFEKENKNVNIASKS